MWATVVSPDSSEEAFTTRPYVEDIIPTHDKYFNIERLPLPQIIPLLGKQDIYELMRMKEYKDSLFIVPIVVRTEYPKYDQWSHIRSFITQYDDYMNKKIPGSFASMIIGVGMYPERLFHSMHIHGPKDCPSHNCWHNTIDYCINNIRERILNHSYKRIFFPAEAGSPRPRFRADGVGKDVLERITKMIYNTGLYGKYERSY